jgi:hypothetical protein
VWIKPELVDGVVTGEPLAEEAGDRGHALRELVERCFSRRCSARAAPVFVDFADDGGDLLRRCATARIGK